MKSAPSQAGLQDVCVQERNEEATNSFLLRGARPGRNSACPFSDESITPTILESARLDAEGTRTCVVLDHPGCRAVLEDV